MGVNLILSIERQQKILDELRMNGSVRVSALMNTFTASESTIRRDLEELEKQDLIKRVHGGAVYMPHMSMEASNFDKEIVFSDEKDVIGKYAANLVKDHSTLILDAGTTTAA